jgi:DNA-binding MarR family transcriptional regulator
MNNHLSFLNNIVKSKLPINQLRILLYIKNNNNCLNRDIIKDLDMHKNAVSNNMTILLKHNLVDRSGIRQSMYHSITKEGEKIVELLTR